MESSLREESIRRQQRSDWNRLPAAVRRRNRRLALLLGTVALGCGLFGPWAVHKGWIYPQETTFAFPNWMK